MKIWHLEYLMNPARCSEAEIQGAIEYYWPCLFYHYRLVLDSCKEVVSERWRPDIFAVEAGDPRLSKPTLLVGELKGVPPAGSLKDTLSQVTRYACDLHEQHPEAGLRLIIIGPWDHVARAGITQEEYAGYHVTAISLEWIADYLLSAVDDLLFWHARNPRLETNFQTPLDNHVFAIKAQDSYEEEDVKGQVT